MFSSREGCAHEGLSLGERRVRDDDVESFSAWLRDEVSDSDAAGTCTFNETMTTLAPDFDSTPIHIAADDVDGIHDGTLAGSGL